MIKASATNVSVRECDVSRARSTGSLVNFIRRFRGSTTMFVLGAATMGFLFIIVQINLDAAATAPRPVSVSKQTVASKPKQKPQQNPDAQEYTKEQLAGYVQWAQQMNPKSQRRGSPPLSGFQTATANQLSGAAPGFAGFAP